MVDGHSIAIGNETLMQEQGCTPHKCRHIGSIVHLSLDKIYAGHIVIADKIKRHSVAAIQRLQQLGIRRMLMLSGDNAQTANSIAHKLGISEVHSELLPADKVAIVENILASNQGHLIYVGDGINDAPVLSRADIGIAMGAIGSDAAIEAADVVLMQDDPLLIPNAISIARRCIHIVYQNITLALGIKFICLGLGAVGLANMWFAIFADVGVMIIAILNAARALYTPKIPEPSDTAGAYA